MRKMYDDGRLVLVVDTEYQPGNGTWYQLVWTRLTSGSAVVTWANAPHGVGPALIGTSGHLCVPYLEEKMGLTRDRTADLATILAWLRDSVVDDLGAYYVVDMPPGYLPNGLHESR